MFAMNKKDNVRLKKAQRFRSILDKNVSFAYVEAFKTLRTNLDFVTSYSEVRSIMVTSALPEESKSTTVLNLAVALAENKYSVIVIEGDLRKPTFQKYLKLKNTTKGLSSLLSPGTDINECITDVEELGISVIHAGLIPPNPSELLAKDRMRVVIEILKQRYDFVIIDTPPMGVVTDAAVVGQVCDGALLIVRSRFTQTKTIRLAKQRLESVGIKILGAILTRYNAKKSGWQSGYTYSDYKYGDGKKWG